MKSNLAIPTDNPFKFLAIFGLVLFLTGPFFVIASTNSTNDTIFKSREAVYKADSSSLPYKEQLIRDLKRKIEIASSDYELHITASAIISTLGLAMMVIGFSVWFKKIYPLEEDLRKKQVKKLEADIKFLNRETPRNRYARR